MNVNLVEFIWFAISMIGLLFALLAYLDAIEDRDAIRKANGRAREIVGDGNVRRERLRIVIQVVLLLVVIPSLFSDRQIELSLPVIGLMLVPLLLVANGALDAQERRRLAAVLETDLATERRRALRDEA